MYRCQSRPHSMPCLHNTTSHTCPTFFCSGQSRLLNWISEKIPSWYKLILPSFLSDLIWKTDRLILSWDQSIALPPLNLLADVKRELIRNVVCDNFIILLLFSRCSSGLSLGSPLGHSKYSGDYLYIASPPPPPSTGWSHPGGRWGGGTGDGRLDTSPYLRYSDIGGQSTEE